MEEEIFEDIENIFYVQKEMKNVFYLTLTFDFTKSKNLSFLVWFQRRFQL